MAEVRVADERIEAAIANWAPRFTSQGVDPNDFRRVTAPLERWEEWLPAWEANGDLHAGLAREAEEAGRALSAGEAWVRAALSYHFGKFVWMVDMERYRAVSNKAIAALYEAHRLLDPAAERVEVPFEDGRLYGNLRRFEPGSRSPLALLLPGLDSTKEEFFHWENVFLLRGMSTFSLDGPGQGESGYATSIRPDYESAVSAALDVLGWDGAIGLAGVSLGGYYAPRAAAFEPRVQAVVSVSGPYCFGEGWDAPAGADEGDLRPPLGRGRPRRGAREGLPADARGRGRADPTAAARRHRRPRPRDRLGGVEADRRRGAELDLGARRGREPRRQRHALPLPPARRRLAEGAAGMSPPVSTSDPTRVPRSSLRVRGRRGQYGHTNPESTVPAAAGADDGEGRA